MQLEQARAVKSLLLAQTRDRLESILAETGGITTRRLDDVQAVRRSVAYGIAPSDDGYRVAVRLQRRELADEVVSQADHAGAGELDVRYIGRIAKLNDWQTLRRPLRIGSSVGHIAITAGTIGAFVRRTDDKRLMILSNNHVLADENAGSPGDTIVQPGRFDGGTADHRIGELHSFVTIEPAQSNHVDAAIAVLDPGIEGEVGLLGDGSRLSGVVAPDADAVDVTKTGRTTGLTAGRITAFDLDNVVVQFDIGNVRFDGQIEIEGAGNTPFSQGGDSGSLIVSTANQAVALLFAGGDQGATNGMGLTYGNPIADVLRALDITLAT